MLFNANKNIIFGYQVAYEEEPQEAQIDSNDLSRKLIEKQEQIYKKQLMEEERARRLAALEESGGAVPEGMDPDEFLDLADGIMGASEPVMEEVVPDTQVTEEMIAEAQEMADAIIADAKEQAEALLNEASLNAEAMKNLARQDGHKEGYNEGTQKAAIELQEAQRRMDEQVAAIEQAYIEKELTMEREIVDMTMGVFEKVFSAELKGRSDVIYHLLDNCIMNIERSNQMQIKVSEANADYISSKKEEILTRLGSDVVLDILADPLLNDSQCIIETDGGIFDCGIDTELESLTRRIRALC